ncbi:MAG: type II toxin-antitoxin system VapC family toxin [Deltaproteobacteria bacterium]|nr:type II toxin-antitoxin system VapC family toxin [Deltaproteobacteria bacterium]
MKIVDINLLIYAINKDTPHHVGAKKWLEDSLSSEEPFGFAWIVILGFLRIVTNGRVLPKPLLPETAMDVVDDWLRQPPSLTVVPSRQHWSIFREILSPLGTAANLTSDAHLAALAIEHGARLYSTDNDFGRFESLRWTNPLE